MNDATYAQYVRGHDKWATIERLNDNQKMKVYTEVVGHFSTVLSAKDTEPEVIGSIAYFYYEYVIFLEKKQAKRDADTYYKAMITICNQALARDPNEFMVRFVLLGTALDNMPEKPNTLSDVVNGKGGAFGKFFNAGFNLTAYNTAKGNLVKALSALQTSFTAKSKPGAAIETCTDMIQKVSHLMSAIGDFDVDTMPICQAVLASEKFYEELTYFDETGLEKAIEQYQDALNNIRGYVQTQQLARR